MSPPAVAGRSRATLCDQQKHNTWGPQSCAGWRIHCSVCMRPFSTPD